MDIKISRKARLIMLYSPRYAVNVIFMSSGTQPRTVAELNFIYSKDISPSPGYWKGWRGGVGTRWEKWASLCIKPLPVKHPITIQDGGIEQPGLSSPLLQNNAGTAG